MDAREVIVKVALVNLVRALIAIVNELRKYPSGKLLYFYWQINNL
tara:strand:+ start:294 stop:428 length:135 start_codon:yes stop_codon:yes gene_type:complete